jgi:dephospho-CoA kinase
MMNVALTGGIGCGKSTVSRIFQILGIPAYPADIEAKKLYSEPDIIEKVKKEFGEGIFKDEIIDTKALAKIVFDDTAALAKLNSIIHPRVLQAYKEWCEPYSNMPYVIMESAIIFEAGLTKSFDRIITVFADKETCIKRIIERDNCSREQVLNRMNMQFDPTIKIKKADFTIYNDEMHLVIPQVLEVHRKLI